MYYLLGHRLMELPISVDRKEVIAENTYLLTLDGDIDFQPAAVKLLVDLMKKNKNLGAACGRIHPVGSGNLRQTTFNLRQINKVLCTTSFYDIRSYGLVSDVRVRYRTLAAKSN